MEKPTADPTLISPEHRAKAARIAERLIDFYHAAVIEKDARSASLLGDNVAGAIRDLDAVSRGPVG